MQYSQCSAQVYLRFSGQCGTVGVQRRFIYDSVVNAVQSVFSAGLSAIQWSMRYSRCSAQVYLRFSSQCGTVGVQRRFICNSVVNAVQSVFSAGLSAIQ